MAAIFLYKGALAVTAKSFAMAAVGSPIAEMVRSRIPRIPYHAAQATTMIMAAGVACYCSYDENTEWPEFLLCSALSSLWGTLAGQNLSDLIPRPTLRGRVK